MENKEPGSVVIDEYLRTDIDKMIVDYYRDMGLYDNASIDLIYRSIASIEYMIVAILKSHKYLRGLNIAYYERVRELRKTRWGRIKLRIWNWIEGR